MRSALTTKGAGTQSVLSSLDLASAPATPTTGAPFTASGHFDPLGLGTQGIARKGRVASGSIGKVAVNAAESTRRAERCVMCGVRRRVGCAHRAFVRVLSARNVLQPWRSHPSVRPPLPASLPVFSQRQRSLDTPWLVMCVCLCPRGLQSPTHARPPLLLQRKRQRVAYGDDSTGDGPTSAAAIVGRCQDIEKEYLRIPNLSPEAVRPQPVLEVR